MHIATDHKVHRRAAYERDLPIGDQLDAIAKVFAALREQGVTLPPETVDWLDRIAAIKARYPKESA